MRSFKKMPIVLWLLFSVTDVLCSSEMHDPTKPLDVNDKTGEIEIKSTGTYVLNGIIIDGPIKKAIINNKILEEGDQIEGLEVKKIEDGKVLLSGKQGDVKLHLFGDPVKGVAE